MLARMAGFYGAAANRCPRCRCGWCQAPPYGCICHRTRWSTCRSRRCSPNAAARFRRRSVSRVMRWLTAPPPAAEPLPSSTILPSWMPPSSVNKGRMSRPGLVPELAAGVIDVDAFSAVATRRAITLAQHAATVHAGDAVGAGELTVNAVHLPLAKPEVECPVRRTGAGQRLLGMGGEQPATGANSAAISATTLCFVTLRLVRTVRPACCFASNTSRSLSFESMPTAANRLRRSSHCHPRDLARTTNARSGNTARESKFQRTLRFTLASTAPERPSCRVVVAPASGS